jgi:DNA-binding response OmpR family regulator
LTLDRTVLVVEQSATLRVTLAGALGRGGWVVQIASFGARGLAIAAWFDPAVLVIDLSLTDIRAVELVRMLHAKGREPRVKVLGLMPELAAEAAVASEIDAILPRSADVERVVEVVELLVKEEN